MSFSAPMRQLPIRCLSPRVHVPSSQYQSSFQHTQRRTALFGRGKKPEEPQSSTPNPVLEEFNRKQAEYEASRPAAQRSSSTPLTPASGDIAASSIFEDDRRQQEQLERSSAPFTSSSSATPRSNPEAIARIIHPDPNSRSRWHRKKVIQMVRSSGRLTKAQFIKRIEREHLSKSHNMKTSVKKLGMLARQIAGKTVDEAIVQMRFSKKKVAQEILKQLEAARDEAVVMRGMGLGAVNAVGAESEEVAGKGTPTQPQSEDVVEIQLKDGKRHKVTDKSKIYIDQAWVGRGPYGQLPDYRARGQVYIMRTPWTSLSLVLKEEATRVREWEEREAKRRRKVTDKVWTHLPDRPIQIQRQWYSW